MLAHLVVCAVSANLCNIARVQLDLRPDVMRQRFLLHRNDAEPVQWLERGQISEIIYGAREQDGTNVHGGYFECAF